MIIPPQSTIFALFALTAVTAAPSLEEIQKALETDLLGDELPLEQVRAFAERRVPAVPDIQDPAKWQTYSAKLRQQILDNIVFRGNLAKYWRESKSKVEWDKTIDKLPGYRIRKFRFEILPGWWCPALLYEPTNLGKVLYRSRLLNRLHRIYS